MKTNIYPSKSLLLSITLFISLLMVSCGTYQNSSYYERDGIYGNSEVRNVERVPNSNSNNHYQDYFSSLQDDNQSTEIFTDIDNYNSFNDTNQVNDDDYAGWGNNTAETSINLNSYNSGFSFGLGYGYSSYGWGYPYYGWNYP